MTVIAKACVLMGEACNIRSYAAQKALRDHSKLNLARGSGAAVELFTAPPGSDGACLKAPRAVLQPPIREMMSLEPASLLTLSCRTVTPAMRCDRALKKP